MTGRSVLSEELSIQPNPTLGGRHPKSRTEARRAIRNRPTIDDVASRAGVSRGTVSRVLNGAKFVSPGSLAAVNRAIKDTGYVVNRSARSLATKRAECIAFVLSEPQERLFEDPNFNVLLRVVTQELGERDINLVLMIAGNPADSHRVIRYLQSDHVDGALLVSTHRGDELMGELHLAGVPMVACGKPLGLEHRIPYVAADDRGGAREMTEYLRAQGCRRIATIAGPLDTSGGVDRLDGYYDVVGNRGSRKLVYVGDYSYQSGERGAVELLDRDAGIDGLFVASDVMASAALAAIKRRGLRIPDDVAVAGFDDSRVAATTDPGLTTMRQPLSAVATEMVRLLLGMIYEGRSPQSVILPTEMVVRDSV
jgi:DNA-binding LacI/PurR family transcriptional regulator